MSLSNAQKGLLKRAQAQAGIGDAEYREHLRTVAGVESSTDPRMTDRHLDVLMSFFEAVFWRGVDQGSLKASCNPRAAFVRRGFWASRNTQESTSRDRFVRPSVVEEIQTLEEELLADGCHPNYVADIMQKVTQGRSDARSMFNLAAALRRTLLARQKKLALDRVQ